MLRKLTATALALAAVGGAGAATALAANPHHPSPAKTAVGERSSVDRASPDRHGGADRSSRADSTRDR